MLKKEKVKISQRGKPKNHLFRGVDENLKSLIHSFRDVLVYYDPDVDGCISGILVCKYLAKHGIRYKWFINSHRSHDWSIPTDKIKNTDIIAVDFIITYEKVRELCDVGCNIVSMDHHINREEFIEYHSDKGTSGYVINNQYPFEDEDSRYLSGAGVVYETLIQLDPEFDTIDNRALVGITLLSDIRDIENPLAERYLYDLYSQKYKGYLKYLIDSTMGDIDYGFGLPRMDRNYVDYKFSPAINSMLRFNRQDEVVNFFLNKGVLDISCRDEQKKLVRDLVKVTKCVEFPHLRVCYFNEENFMEYADVLSSFVGLEASKYLGKGKSVICYMIGITDKGEKYVKRASFRGNINGLPYRDVLLDKFTCLGHASAFGIKNIKPNKKLFMECSDLLQQVEVDSRWERKIIDVVNMSLFVNKSAYEIAEDNMYKLSQNQTYIRYTGSNIEQKRTGAKYSDYREFLVNGIPVKCFDKEVDFKTGLIVPILDRGLLTFVLE